MNHGQDRILQEETKQIVSLSFVIISSKNWEWIIPWSSYVFVIQPVKGTCMPLKMFYLDFLCSNHEGWSFLLHRPIYKRVVVYNTITLEKITKEERSSNMGSRQYSQIRDSEKQHTLLSPWDDEGDNDMTRHRRKQDSLRQDGRAGASDDCSLCVSGHSICTSYRASSSTYTIMTQTSKSHIFYRYPFYLYKNKSGKTIWKVCIHKLPL